MTMTTHLLLTPFQDDINVVIRDGGILGSEHLICTVPDHLQHILLFQLLFVVNKSTRLNDDIVQSQFHLGTLDDTLLDCVLCDQFEYSHLFLLTDSVSTILK